MTESIHKFTTTFHLPDFCQLSFFVIYVSFHTFRIYTRYRSFGLFIPVFAFHKLIINGHPTPRIAIGLLFVTKNIVQICKIYRFMIYLPQQVYEVVGTAASAAIGTPPASNWSPGSAPTIPHLF